MFRSLLAIVLSLFISCAAAPSSFKERAQAISQAELSLVLVSNAPDGESGTVCSGVVVDAAKGWILTVAHCIDPEAQMFVNATVPVEVVKAGVQGGLALLKFPAMSLGPPLELRKSKLQRGEEVVGVGYGGGLPITVFTRFVSFPKDADGDVLLDGPMIPGMSGAPVVDMDGKLVGIVERSAYERATTAIHGQDEIREFLKAK